MNVDTWIDKRTIFKCMAGSHAYGLNTEASDEDFRGVCIPPKAYFLGATLTFHQKELKGEQDVVIFNIIKFIKLALDNNPNILELLFMPEDCIVHTSPEWKRLEEMKLLFLSKKVRHTYAGYAHSQIKRVKTHRNWLLNPPTKKPTREDFGLPEQTQLPAELRGAIETVIRTAIKDELTPYLNEIGAELTSDMLRHQIEFDVQAALDEAFMDFTINPMTRKLELNDSVALEVGFNFFSEEIMAIYEKERAYNNALNHWKQYENWVKTRNPKRAELEKKFGYDTKHMSHVFRLLIQGEEILSKSTLSVRLSPEDQKYCRDIRAGAFPYEEMISKAEALMGETFNTLYSQTTLPNAPAIHKVDAVLVDIVDRFIRND